MIPLSMQNRSSVANTFPPRSLAMIPIISCKRSLPERALYQQRWSDGRGFADLHPTPPTISTSLLPICAIARSVISISIAKTVSCKEKQRSAGVIVSFSSDGSAIEENRLSYVYASVALRMPERLTSIPFVVYGRGNNFFPLFLCEERNYLRGYKALTFWLLARCCTLGLGHYSS